MSNRLRVLSIAIVILASVAATAGPVTGLITFTAGTPAKASDVNANFAAVKSAADDTNTRLTTAEANKQNRVTGTCAVGSSVTAVAADGTVTCAAAPPDSRFGANTSLAAIGTSNETCTMGHVWLVAGTTASATPAAGQLLPIASNINLYSLLGTTYGGDGSTNFALPDLRKAAPNGLTYVICMQGYFPAKS